jgi:hypothetical protein
LLFTGNQKEEKIMNTLLKRLLVAACAVCALTLIGIGASPQDEVKGEDSKYGKYIISTDLYREIDHYTGTSLVSHSGELKAPVSMGYHCLAKPISFDKPHSHDFQEILCFTGGNPLDITDFDAIVEYTIGDEKHVITKPACVSMPPGQVHCPISIKNVSVEKPIVFLEISLAPEYGKPKDAE